jgi:hypothetical protein
VRRQPVIGAEFRAWGIMFPHGMSMDTFHLNQVGSGRGRTDRGRD